MLHDAQGPSLTLLLPWNVADYAVLSPVILYWQSKLCRMQHAQRETRRGATWGATGRGCLHNVIVFSTFNKKQNLRMQPNF